ncbi:hypothetical protein SGL43_06577 [Streptomyces globisporus]|uniref:SAM-dependent methyltransferase n=1 Tax=Streptomyces globisporus TaxID=1908 RepID=A0ABM9H7C8_STRGL|nr:hypothetical protein SGL43_06577 [Streptomyces globisporus]
MTPPSAPAPLPPWEDTAREVAQADDRYWDARYERDEE